jgi:hypothetical protein
MLVKNDLFKLEEKMEKLDRSTTSEFEQF